MNSLEFKRLRMVNRYHQKDLAKLLGVAYPTVVSWENKFKGRDIPKFSENLIRLGIKADRGKFAIFDEADMVNVDIHKRGR